jgi:starch-binding outer membrane protein, SusD/RagB family
MKSIHKKALIVTAVMTMFLGACSDILEENPRSIYEPGYFTTEQGVYGGLTSLYAHLRYIYGQAYYYNACLTGTDEATWGQSADGNFKDMDLNVEGTLTPTSSRTDVLWDAAFPNINTASGIIENASAVGLPDALVAEARFFRAFDYFVLVQTFGGVPLDLGSGELVFNTKPARISVRNTVSEVYTKGIFPDLLQAVIDLEETGRVTGGITKTTARLFLAKAYLTYGWWLENPNDIPTYPAADRIDPDGHDAQWYFQQAYDVAITAIDNPGEHGLQPTFYDVNLAQNDYNSEQLLYADHTEFSEYYNGGSLEYGTGAAPDNFAAWMLNWNMYTATSVSEIDGTDKTYINPFQRVALQEYGRPWTRMAPPIGVLENTFADKTNDSRYDGTFTTVYRANWTANPELSDVTFVYNANDIQVYPGEPIISFLPDESLAGSIDYDHDEASHVYGCGEVPGRADYVRTPRASSRLIFPALWKLGGWRTDTGAGVGQPNAGHTRPFIIAKFSELYLVAAEAAVKGATTIADKSARELVNVLRARAGVWTYSNADRAAKNDVNSKAMTDATPATIDIDYILAERSRELYGEGYRWFDLVRTQTWEEIAGTYEICGSYFPDHTPELFTRFIEDYLYLRPIPIGHMDGLEIGELEKAAYQNPGYE